MAGMALGENWLGRNNCKYLLIPANDNYYRLKGQALLIESE
jgi:hypothetical protein